MSASSPCRAARGRAAVAVLALLPLLVCLGAGTAHAEERVVIITADGVRPQALEVEPGDTVRFVNLDRDFAYRAQSTGGAWSFDSGPVTLLDADFVVPRPLTTPGSYAYRVAQDPPYRGTVVVGAAAAVPTAPAPVTPAPSTPAVPTPDGSPAPAPSPAPPAVPGALAAPPTGRALGLPAAVAAVLVLGAASLLLRLLLAEPVLSDRPARLRAAGAGPPRW